MKSGSLLNYLYDVIYLLHLSVTIPDLALHIKPPFRYNTTIMALTHFQQLQMELVCVSFGFAKQELPQPHGIQLLVSLLKSMHTHFFFSKISVDKSLAQITTCAISWSLRKCPCSDFSHTLHLWDTDMCWSWLVVFSHCIQLIWTTFQPQPLLGQISKKTCIQSFL